MSKKITLLAPAKDFEVGKCAIDAGADAVYIGAPAYSAREAANNSLENIQRLIDYAHCYDANVLIALNTLLSDDERQHAVDLMWQLYEINADAIILQDLRLLTHDLPPIRLHASTQCDNRTIAQVEKLHTLGFARAVLARELSLEEIHKIHCAVPQIELEVFVHGALCVCFSGRCYMSEKLLGRSANRGVCAQMCRMPYDLLDDKKNELAHQKYLLSLKDMDRSAHLQKLIDSGVTALKIEGRLKNKEYVTNVVAFYRQLLDKILGKTHQYQYSFTPNPQKTFQRGQTNYFLFGRDVNMANWETPKSVGESIGNVRKQTSFDVTLELKNNIILHNGDGITYGDKGFYINKITTTEQANVVKITPNTNSNIQPQTPLFRNYDKTFYEHLTAKRFIPIDISLLQDENTLILRYENFSKTIENTFPTAQNAELALKNIQTQLAKLNDTMFCVNSLTINLLTVPFIPLATLNSWRREAVSALLERCTIQKEKACVLHQKIQPNALQSHENEPLMTCKYCLLFEMGHCRRKNPLPNEPKFIRLKNGKTMRLKFDCQQCLMTIWEC